MEKYDIEIVCDDRHFETIDYGREIYVKGFILKGHCKLKSSKKDVYVKLTGAYSDGDYTKGYLRLYEDILCLSLNKYPYHNYLACFKPKKKSSEIIPRLKKGLGRILDEISNFRGDENEYFYMDSRKYLDRSDYLYLTGIFDLYKESTGDLIYFFNNKSISEEDKKLIIEYIYNCDFENPMVIEFLEQNERDLLREVAFS